MVTAARESRGISTIVEHRALRFGLIGIATGTAMTGLLLAVFGLATEMLAVASIVAAILLLVANVFRDAFVRDGES